jgi:allantoinase
METNDIPLMAVQHHEAPYFAQKCKDTFDRLYEEGAARPKIMAIAIHPYLSGQPSRIKYLESIYEYMAEFNGVLYWTGEQILGWYLKARE